MLRDFLVPGSIPLWCGAALVVAALALASPRGSAATRVPGSPTTRGIVAPTLVGVFGSWRAVTHRAAGRLVCYAYTRSLTSTPHLPGRGDVVLSVTEREGAPRDAVALSAGFRYPQGSDVTVTAGTAHLRFYTGDRSAFARSGAGAMRAFDAADRAVARSPAPRGHVVTDVFSLDGFQAAHHAIQKACPSRA